MKNIIVGVAGHVDHGKSSLVRALTGGVTDRLPEEKRRGLTIEPGFQILETPESRIYFVDMPGHESFARNMICGTCGADCAVLCVDAGESVMPQTEEHAFILKGLGISKVAAAVTKIDLYDERRVEKTSSEADSLLKDYGFSDFSVIRVSAFSRSGLVSLTRILDDFARKIDRSEDEKKRFRMYVDRAFSLKGAGTIITGSVLTGTIKNDDKVYLYPASKTVSVREIRTGSEKPGLIGPGQRAALNLRNVGPDEACRGSVAFAAPGPELLSGYKIKIIPRPGYEKAVKNNKTYNIFMGSSKNRGKVLKGLSEIILASPCHAALGDRFLIRNGSPETTHAAGVILGPAERVKRERVRVSKNAQPMPMPDVEKIALALETERKPVTASRIEEKTGAPREEVLKALKYLSNRETAVTLGKHYTAAGLFKTYSDAVREIIRRNGFADIASVRGVTGLSRDLTAALLDKGDAAGLWKNINGRRI